MKYLFHKEGEFQEVILACMGEANNLMIKNKIFLILIVFVCVGTIILMYIKDLEADKTIFTGEEYLLQQGNKDDIIYIDYPLLEFYFLGDNKWDFIIEDCANSNYHLINDNEILEGFKTNIVLNTFPVGRGTSADGYIYLYKNSELVKKVPFTQITSIGTTEFSFDNLKNYSEQDIKNICGYLVND